MGPGIHNRSFLLLGVVLALVAWIDPAAGEESSMALPEWTENDARRFGDPGSVLLGGGLWPMELQPTPLPSIGERPEGFPRGPGEAAAPSDADLDAELNVPRIVIHRGGALAGGRFPDEESLGPAGVISKEYEAAYFSERPKTFLVDPQQLLFEQKANDINRFLEYHDGESAIPIYVLIFGGRQELPHGVNLSGLYDRWFPGENVVLLSYFLGEPKYCVLEFGQSGSASLGAAAVTEILDSCIQEAQVAENSFNQLERFCIELSIRLYWVERTNAMHGSEPSLTVDASVPSEGAASPPNRVRFAILSLAGCAVALGGLGWLVWRFWAFPSRTFVFPVYEITPRLSAPHSGGAHAVMYFGKKGER